VSRPQAGADLDTLEHAWYECMFPLWARGAAWLAHWTVNPEVAGSNPVEPAIPTRYDAGERRGKAGGPPTRDMNRDDREGAAMGRTIALLVLLLLGSWSYAALAWATGGSVILPPQEIVAQIRVVDRAQSRIIMEERGLEIWATDAHQLDGLVAGQKVRVRFQQDGGRQILYSITPLPK
jgi:hypothetical protein